jgi:hypothetical protein
VGQRTLASPQGPPPPRHEAPPGRSRLGDGLILLWTIVAIVVTTGGVVITTVLRPSLADHLQQRARPDYGISAPAGTVHFNGAKFSGGEISFYAKSFPALFYF